MSSTQPYKKAQQLTFTQINIDQFLIEGIANKIKIGGENEYAITYLDFENGPLIHLGHNFLGRGQITNIELIEPDNIDYIIAKITITNKDKS